jgi:phospholipid transport system substrate-binding protein
MSNLSNKAGVIVFWLLASMTAPQALAQDDAAYNLVQDTTVRIMEVVVAADEYVETDPERYYQQVQGLLDPLIDFRAFARKVMGPYGSSERYRSLNEAERGQLRDQLDRFTEAMRSSLVRTYSKGLLAFGSSRIELLPPDEPAEGETSPTRISLQQLVYADRALPYEVLYQMGQGKSGGWKLLNVIIESVNLGEVYRDQFLASAREQDGNLDAVIDNWAIVVVEVDE